MAGQTPETFGLPPEDWSQWVAWLQIGLHGRSRWRLPLVLAGLLLARGRRTVSSWLRAAQLQADYVDYYYFNGSLGRKANEVATRLFCLLLQHLPLPERIVRAVELLQWAVNLLKPWGKPIWAVMDGAYAYRPLLKPILAMGVTVVSRLRRDAGLRTLPPPAPRGRRGPRRKYGFHRISLAKRAAHPQGWQTLEAVLYGGRLVTKTYKTFLATWPVVGGTIRVVLVRESREHWDAFFCTDPAATTRQILECYADRSAIEQVFHDIKEVWGAGEQQVRNLWRNIGCFHLNLWMHTLVELWAWHRSAEEIRNRSDSPWDNPSRRPSHGDRRKALRDKWFQNVFSVAPTKHKIPEEIQNLLTYLAHLAT